LTTNVDLFISSGGETELSNYTSCWCRCSRKRTSHKA